MEGLEHGSPRKNSRELLLENNIRENKLANSLEKYTKIKATKFYHGTTLANAKNILKDGFEGDKLFITTNPETARYFGKMKRPWFCGEKDDRTVIVLELTPNNYLSELILAKPIVTMLNNGISAQYVNDNHFQNADIAWNSEYRYQFLTKRGFEKYSVNILLAVSKQE